MTFFSGKISIFTAKISDDLFYSSTRFFGFSLSFPRFSVSLICKMSYMTLSSQEKHLCLLCSYFTAHSTTLLLRILGGRMHGPSPHLKFFRGTVPPQSPQVSAPAPTTHNMTSEKQLRHFDLQRKFHGYCARPKPD